jgi:hypothetical protein
MTTDGAIVRTVRAEDIDAADRAVEALGFEVVDDDGHDCVIVTAD